VGRRGDLRLTDSVRLARIAVAQLPRLAGGLWAEGKLADKVHAGFTSANTVHGGQETTWPVRGSGRRPGHLLNLTATPRYRDDLLKNAPIKSISTNRGSGCFGDPHRLLHLK
jgi:multimeric flavodoxin WrbA